jgi:hypothetical protein
MKDWQKRMTSWSDFPFGLKFGKEFQDRFVDARMKADTALVGADRVVVLHAPAAIHPDIAFIVFPAHAERHGSIRFRDTAHDLVFVIHRLVGDELENRLRNFVDRLMELGLTGVAFP